MTGPTCDGSKYLFLEELALLRGQSVGFCNERDDVDFVVKPLHELDVQRLQTEETKRRDFFFFIVFMKANLTKEGQCSSSTLSKQLTNM